MSTKLYRQACRAEIYNSDTRELLRSLAAISDDNGRCMFSIRAEKGSEPTKAFIEFFKAFSSLLEEGWIVPDTQKGVRRFEFTGGLKINTEKLAQTAVNETNNK